MTLRQVFNIKQGHFDKLKTEHETRVFENRIFLMYYASMKNEKIKKTFEDIYPISIDQEQKKTNKIPKELFSKLLVSFFKNNNE